MTTGDTWVNIALKRFLSANRMKTNFLEYLQSGVFDALSVMLPSQGLFTFPVTLTGDGVNGTIDVTPDPVVGTDGLGHILSLIGTDRTTGVPFPNENGQKFWAALKWCVAPENVYSNPRTGLPEYDLWREEVGELDAPDSVTNMGGYLRLVVDVLFENGVDYSGRTVTVWLVNPVSPDETVAFEDCIVAYNGGTGENYIDTSGVLGQGTVSVVASDYQVACFGMTFKKSATDPFGAGYLKLGWVQGGLIAPLPWSQDGQYDLSGGGGHTLQKAYDGAGGTGSGRDITISGQAVQVFSENVTARATDVANSALSLRKNLSTLSWGFFQGEVGLDIPITYTFGAGVIVRYPIADLTADDFLRVSETVDLVVGGNTINFTRAGVDLTFSGNNTSLLPYIDMVEISGSTLGQDGLYYIATVPGATSLTLNELNMGTFPTFLAETGLTAKVFRAVARIGSRHGSLNVATISDLLEDKTGTTDQWGIVLNIPPGANPTDPAFIIRDGSIPYGITTALFKVANNGKIEGKELWLEDFVFPGTTQLADEYRIVTEIIGSGTSSYTLMWEMDSLPAGGKGKIRLYASDDTTALYGSPAGARAFVITHNAWWDASISQWKRENALEGSTRWDFGQTGRFLQHYYQALGASPWTDASWSTLPNGSPMFHFMPYGTNGEVLQRMNDAIIQILNTTAWTNPTLATAVNKNTLYAKNIPKAWARVRTDGIGGISLDDAFNIGTPSLVPTPGGSVARLPFSVSFANLYYSATATSGNSTGPSPYLARILTIPTINCFGNQCDVFVFDAAGVLVDLGTNEETFHVHIIGEQSS